MQSNERIHTGCRKKLEDKAAKWDEFCKEHETISNGIERVKEWKEKAKKWDDGIMDHLNKYWMPPDRAKELEEKAKKWNKLCGIWENPEDLYKKNTLAKSD